MSKEIYMYNNLIDNLNAITASEEDASGTFDIENTSDDWKYPSYTWRTDGDITVITIVIDMGSATAIEGFALLNINFGSATIALVQAHTADAWGAPSESELLELKTRIINGVDRYDAYHIPSSAWNYRWFRFAITLPAGPYVEAGSIFLARNAYTVIKSAMQYSRGRDILASKNEDGIFTGHITRKVNAQRSPIGLNYVGIAETQRALMFDISESDNCCFLPIGDGGDIYFGFAEFSQANPIIPTIPTPIFNINGSFTEVFK